MEIVEKIALISINATMVVQLLSFLLFMVLFNRIMIRPLRKIMGERARYMEQMRQQIIETDENLIGVADQIKQQEREVRQTALTIKRDAETDAQQLAMDVMGQTKKEINTLRKEAQQSVDTKIADARRSIQAEAEILSDKMADVLLGRRGRP